MTVLHIHLFQRFDVGYDDTIEVEGLGAQKVQELICYLLLFRHRPHHRELLASQLWEQGSLANAKKKLRQLLWQINSSPPQSSQASCADLLVIDRDWIQVNAGANLWLDVAEFESAYQAAQGVQGCDLTLVQADRLASAVRLYRGQLLEGWYQEWCLAERERLHNIYLIMLDKVLSHSERRQDYEAGIQYGALALGSDPARERTHRRLMRLHYVTGHRSAALRQYEACVVALHEELEVEPGAKTRLLYDEMRSGRFGATTTEPATSLTAQQAPAELAAQLDKLQAMVDLVQAQLNLIRSSCNA